METQNPYLVKKTVNVPKIVQEEIEIIDWDKVPKGTYMTAKIGSTDVEGILYKEDGQLYICQNLKVGAEAPYKYGYLYSWSFIQHSDGTHNADVSDIQFPPMPNNLVIPPTPSNPIFMEVGEYDAKVYSDHIKVGCQTISKQIILEVLANMEKHSQSIK